METLLDEISFEAPDMQKKEIIIDAQHVEEKLNEIIEDEDLSRYIL
jgi:ATP-dependent HslUV protease ATP-binding subunit HslU